MQRFTDFWRTGESIFNVSSGLWVDGNLWVVQKHQYSVADICVLFIFGPLEKPATSDDG